jgi:hypothetical protein
VPIVVTGALAAALLASLAVAFLGFSGRGVSGTTPPASVPPQTWQDLFTQAPVELHWPKLENNSKWFFQDRERELHVACEGGGMLRLGETTSRAYELEVGVSQVTHWGGVGLFFGYQDDDERGKPWKKYQALRLTSRLDNTPDPKFRVDLLIASWKDEAVKVSHSPKSAEVPQPTSQEHRLKIVVGKAGLRSVWWDDAELRALTAPDLNSPPQEADLRGVFGVYNSGSTSVYRNARYRTLPEDP